MAMEKYTTVGFRMVLSNPLTEKQKTRNAPAEAIAIRTLPQPFSLANYSGRIPTKFYKLQYPGNRKAPQAGTLTVFH